MDTSIQKLTASQSIDFTHPSKYEILATHEQEDEMEIIQNNQPTNAKPPLIYIKTLPTNNGFA